MACRKMLLMCCAVVPLSVGAASVAQETKRIWAHPHGEAYEALSERLRSDTVDRFEFHETPLGTVVDYLRETQGLAIQVDEVALDELGLSVDEPLSIDVENVTLGTALELLLEPLELTVVTRGRVLEITTEDEALSRLKVAIYPVGDLLLEGDFYQLIDAITSTIAPDTWAENGGGEAEIVPYPQRGVLIVSQTDAVHEALERFVRALREAPVDPQAKTQPPRPPMGGGAGCGDGTDSGSGSFGVATREPTPADEKSAL